MFQRVQQPIVDRALRLFLNTQVSFAECQANGIKVDVEYLDSVIGDTERELGTLEEEIWNTREGKLWRSMYGDLASLSKRQQLADVLFNKNNPDSLGLDAPSYTESGLPQVAAESLENSPKSRNSPAGTPVGVRCRKC